RPDKPDGSSGFLFDAECSCQLSLPTGVNPAESEQTQDLHTSFSAFGFVPSPHASVGLAPAEQSTGSYRSTWESLPTELRTAVATGKLPGASP
ncbi:MAG: hypothetical protein KDB01_26450, partial [Planctomycetaceae bacterium]|nr:hypothetical protein [Planctomycetaceae bacterium]